MKGEDNEQSNMHYNTCVLQWCIDYKQRKGFSDKTLAYMYLNISLFSFYACLLSVLGFEVSGNINLLSWIFVQYWRLDNNEFMKSCLHVRKKSDHLMSSVSFCFLILVCII